MPNVEIRRVTSPKPSGEVEDVRVYKAIGRRKGQDAVFASDLSREKDPDWRDLRHPSMGKIDCISDWIWCEQCDWKLAQERPPYGGWTCAHCASS